MAFVAASVSVLKIGSLEPGAMLNDALKEFEVRVKESIPHFVLYTQRISVSVHTSMHSHGRAHTHAH